MSPPAHFDPPSRHPRPLWLEDCYLSREASQTLDRVAPTHAPILCLDSFGPAFARLAEAIHAASGRDRLVVVDLRSARDAMLAGLIRVNASPRSTIAIDGIELLDVDGQRALLRTMDRDGPRLVSSSLVPLEQLRESCRPEFFALISTVTVEAPALARRGIAIGEVAAIRMAQLCAELERAVPRLASDALQALAAHSWPGDLAELDAVLFRTLLEVEGELVRESELRWSPTPLRRERSPECFADVPEPPWRVTPAREASETPAEREAPAEAPRATEDPVASEAIAVELAHQLKNPLVTVKTFVQNVAHLTSDPSDLARFRDLTDEAITRMDDVLEELLAFARLAPARREAIDVIEMLRDALREAWPAFGQKEIGLTAPNGLSLRVLGDREHLRLAFAALARYLLEAIEPRTALALSRDDASSLSLRYRESGLSTHLRGVTGLEAGSFPLALMLVRGALARMSARLEVVQTDGDVLLRIRFAPVATTPAA
jgi:phospho-acceptor domain-containing protein